MLVSIIIPAFNAEKFIKDAIDSALNQTYKDTEIIVVDDGSTNSLPVEFWEKYSPLIKIYCHKENRGIASALNTGIKMSKGEWIKWLSADDMLRPNAIEVMMKWVKEKNCIYYTHYHIINEKGKIKKEFREPARPESDLWNLFFGNGSSSLINKKVFEICGFFDESLKHSEDYEFWLRATQIYGMRLILIPEFTLLYRSHPDQLTHKVGGTLDVQIKDSIRKRITEIRH